MNADVFFTARGAVQKSTPTWIHGLLQRILMDMLWQAGFKSAPEVRLKIDPEVQLIPDVIATRGRIEILYPVKALEVVIEILSESDTMSRTLSKCRAYQTWGFDKSMWLIPTRKPSSAGKPADCKKSTLSPVCPAEEFGKC